MANVYDRIDLAANAVGIAVAPARARADDCVLSIHGHYARSDLFRLVVDERAKPVLQLVPDPAAPPVHDLTAPGIRAADEDVNQ